MRFQYPLARIKDRGLTLYSFLGGRQAPHARVAFHIIVVLYFCIRPKLRSRFEAPGTYQSVAANYILEASFGDLISRPQFYLYCEVSFIATELDS